MNQINYFHNQIGNSEWSGILFYSVKGSIEKPEELELIAEKIYIKDVGSAASTDFEFDEEIFDFFEAHPDTENMKMGLIHTHHDMKCYFSHTDDEELVDNAPNHNYYLSLICNFACHYKAKIAIEAKTETSIRLKTDNGKYKKRKEKITNSQVITYDCDIFFQEIDNFTADKVKELKKNSLIKIAEKEWDNFNGYSKNYHKYRKDDKNLDIVKSDTIKTSKREPLDTEKVKEMLVSWYYDSPYPGSGTYSYMYEGIFNGHTFDLMDEEDSKEAISHMRKNFYPLVANFMGDTQQETINDFCNQAVKLIEESGEEVFDTPFGKQLIDFLTKKVMEDVSK